MTALRPPGSPRYTLTATVAVVLVASFVLGVIWSYGRVGDLDWRFVREAQFLLGIASLAGWTVRNWSDRRRPPSASSAGDDRPETVDRSFVDVDAVLLAVGLGLLVLSVGVDVIRR